MLRGFSSRDPLAVGWARDLHLGVIPCPHGVPAPLARQLPYKSMQLLLCPPRTSCAQQLGQQEHFFYSYQPTKTSS